MENNIYLLLAKARLEIQKKCTKKSGLNKYAGFEYFELKDFLSIATQEFEKVGLVALFNIESKRLTLNEMHVANEVGIEKATLTITDGKSEIVFTTPTAEANVKGANDIQNLGSKHTYLKRYLYMNAIELSEADGVDATIGKEEPKKNATTKQIEIIKNLISEEKVAEEKVLNFFGKTKIEELTIDEADKVIKGAKK